MKTSTWVLVGLLVAVAIWRSIEDAAASVAAHPVHSLLDVALNWGWLLGVFFL